MIVMIVMLMNNMRTNFAGLGPWRAGGSVSGGRTDKRGGAGQTKRTRPSPESFVAGSTTLLSFKELSA
jgi:hypothetical protein